MQVKFKTYGHKNIQATHNRTLEFTKHKELSIKGDCIIGVNSDFSPDEIKKLLKSDKIKITIKVDELTDTVECQINKEFSDEEEIVVRIGEFKSKRTLGIRADKASSQLKREMFEKMKEPGKEMQVIIETII